MNIKKLALATLAGGVTMMILAGISHMNRSADSAGEGDAAGIHGLIGSRINVGALIGGGQGVAFRCGSVGCSRKAAQLGMSLVKIHVAD